MGSVYYHRGRSSAVMTVLGLDRRDGRNLLVVAALMTVVMAFFIDAPIGVKLVAGGIMGLVSGVAFVVSTLVINRLKPDYW